MDLRNANFDPYTGQQLRPLPPDFPYGNRSMPTAVRTVQHPGRGNARSTAGSIAFWSAVVFDVVAWGILCLFAMFWLTGELPLASAFENSRTYIEEPPFAETIATDYYRNTLSGEDLKAYDEMEYALRTMSTMKVIDAKIPDQERIQYLFSCVKADNPDIFWCSVNWRCYQSNAGNFILEINYLYDDPEEVKAMHTAYIKRAYEIAGSVDRSSEYATMLDLHNWVADACTYEGNPYDQGVDSVFDEGRSVCAGYSRTFQFLCSACGIPCLYVMGSTNGASDSHHAWNMVNADGQTYYVDVTWDDHDTDVFKTWIMTERDYFESSHVPALTDAELSAFIIAPPEIEVGEPISSEEPIEISVNIETVTNEDDGAESNYINDSTVFATPLEDLVTRDHDRIVESHETED